MSTTHDGTNYAQGTATARRVSTETKSSLKTTELLAYIAAVAGVLAAAQISDNFTASRAWLYVTILTVGYMVSRGLAKSGSRDFYDDRRDDTRGY